MKITTRIGHLNDPRITKTTEGYRAVGVVGVFKTWLQAFEAMDDQHRRDFQELQNFHK
jgi:hypothetical protein